MTKTWVNFIQRGSSITDPAVITHHCHPALRDLHWIRLRPVEVRRIDVEIRRSADCRRYVHVTRPSEPPTGPEQSGAIGGRVVVVVPVEGRKPLTSVIGHCVRYVAVGWPRQIQSVAVEFAAD